MTTVRPLRVAFAGTPQFAVPALAALLASPHTVVGVLTQPDRPRGRGRQRASGPVKAFAVQHGVPVAQPETLRDQAGLAALAALRPEVMVVVAYGQLLPRAVLQLPPLGCINIHGSLLPRWRGAAPIQRAILAGDADTGVTLMQMDEGLDTGAMLATRRVPIGERDTSAALHDTLAALGAQALPGVLEQLAAGTAEPQAQPSSGITYAQKIAKAEALIDWRQPAVVISRQVRAFNPWPVAETVFAGEQLRIHDAYAAPGELGGAPGDWLGVGPDSQFLRVACGTGELRVTRLQRAGRRIITAQAFMNSSDRTAGCFG